MVDRMSVKHSYAELMELMKVHKGDAIKAWSEWEHEDWRHHLIFGIGALTITKEELIEKLASEYRKRAAEIKREADWWRDKQNRPDVADRLLAYHNVGD